MKIWTEQNIKDLLRNETAVKRAIVALWKKQTIDEKFLEQTKHSNGVGFNAYDAYFGTILAQRIIKDIILSPRDILTARRIVHKYIKQLTEIANTNEVKKNLIKE